MAIRKIETDDFIVEFDDTPELRDAVFERLLKFYSTDIESFSGECMVQGDSVYIVGPPMLGEIADEIIKFDVKWKD